MRQRGLWWEEVGRLSLGRMAALAGGWVLIAGGWAWAAHAAQGVPWGTGELEGTLLAVFVIGSLTLPRSSKGRGC